jgi:lysozyme
LDYWLATGRGVTPDTVWTQQQCDDRLASDLRRYARDVSDTLANVPTTQAQFDALVCFHYNTSAIRRATLTRLHRARQQRQDFIPATDHQLPPPGLASNPG